ncbi:MAG: DUF2125 domain-containing protein [Alphaproteobacteria bacterium]|nr:DUF2125 domain-containing protein [Alphaproteobacteria bacterium]
MRRRLILIIAVTAITVAITVTAGWFFFVQQTKSAINQWAEIQRENGTDVTWQELTFSGFPLRIDTQFDTPQMVIRQRGRQAIWKPSFLTFKVSSITPNAVDFVSPGSHDLNFTQGDAAWSALIEAETLEGEALFPPANYQKINQLTGQFAGVRVTPVAWAEPITIERGNFDVTLSAPTATVQPQGDSLALDLTARSVGLPPNALKGTALEILGPLVDRFSTVVQVTGELDTGATDIATLTAWRDGGGTVEFASIELLWESLRITANGTLALDSELQPAGSFATRIAGFGKFITAMEEAGAITPNDAAIARITLAVLTRASDDGGPDRAEIPITLQDRIVRLGPVALIELPPIVWE